MFAFRLSLLDINSCRTEVYHQRTKLHAFALHFWKYLVNLVQNIYAGNVDPAALYAVHKVVNVTVFLEMNVCIVDLVL